MDREGYCTMSGVCLCISFPLLPHNVQHGGPKSEITNLALQMAMCNTVFICYGTIASKQANHIFNTSYLDQNLPREGIRCYNVQHGGHE